MSTSNIDLGDLGSSNPQHLSYAPLDKPSMFPNKERLQDVQEQCTFASPSAVYLSTRLPI